MHDRDSSSRHLENVREKVENNNIVISLQSSQAVHIKRSACFHGHGRIYFAILCRQSVVSRRSTEVGAHIRRCSLMLNIRMAVVYEKILWSVSIYMMVRYYCTHQRTFTVIFHPLNPSFEQSPIHLEHDPLSVHPIGLWLSPSPQDARPESNRHIFASTFPVPDPVC